MIFSFDIVKQTFYGMPIPIIKTFLVFENELAIFPMYSDIFTFTDLEHKILNKNARFPQI